MQHSFNADKDPRKSWINQDFTVGRIKTAFNRTDLLKGMHSVNRDAVLLNLPSIADNKSTSHEVLGWAMGRNYTDIVTALLKQSPELVNHKRGFGMTPAMDAAHQGNPDMMKLIIAAGADLTATSASGHNALDYAIDRNNQECIGLIKAALPQSTAVPAVEAEMPESMVLIVMVPKQKFGG